MVSPEFTVNKPSARRGPVMVYDSAYGATVLFGGYAGSDLDDTWKYDGVNWSQQNPASKPSARRCQAMAYDSARGLVVLFGGRGDAGGYVNDTWEY